jgi:hypothetical protein
MTKSRGVKRTKDEMWRLILLAAETQHIELLPTAYTTSHMRLGGYCHIHDTILHPKAYHIVYGTAWCNKCACKKVGALHSLKAKERFIKEAASRGILVVGDWIDSETPTHCICPKGHDCYPRPSDVMHKNASGWCAKCGRETMGRKQSAVCEKNFRQAAKNNSIQIVGEYVDVFTPVHCMCSKGHDCYPTPRSIQQKHRWCRKCEGYKDFTLLYLVYKRVNFQWWAKVGIAAGERRIKDHEARGWSRLRIYTNILHDDLIKLEKLVLTNLPEHEFLSQEYMPQTGYTETFPYRLVDTAVHIIESNINYMP